MENAGVSHVGRLLSNHLVSSSIEGCREEISRPSPRIGFDPKTQITISSLQSCNREKKHLLSRLLPPHGPPSFYQQSRNSHRRRRVAHPPPTILYNRFATDSTTTTPTQSPEERWKHKHQSKVETHSSEWSVYSSTPRRPRGFCCLMLYALRSWPTLIRGYVSLRDANVGRNHALGRICFCRDCSGNCDNSNLFWSPVPLRAMMCLTSKRIILRFCECSRSSPPLRFLCEWALAVEMLIRPGLFYRVPSFDLVISGWRKMEFSVQPQRSEQISWGLGGARGGLLYCGRKLNKMKQEAQSVREDRVQDSCLNLKQKPIHQT